MTILKLSSLSIISIVVLLFGCTDAHENDPGQMKQTVQEQPIHYIEVVTPDVETMCAHYKASNAWEFEKTDPALGNARVITLPNGILYGIRAPMNPQEVPAVRIYLRVDDLDASVKKASDLGATVLIDRMEIPGHGVIAIYEHGGIQQGLWQVE